MMSYEKLLSKITEFEKTHDVSKLRYKGICFWPVIRAEIHFQIRETRKKEYKSSSSLKRPLFKFKLNRLIRKLDFNFTNLKESENLFCSEENQYIESLNSKAYNRHFDPILEYFEENKVDYLKLTPNNQNELEARPGTSLDFKQFEEYLWLRAEFKMNTEIPLLNEVSNYFGIQSDYLKNRIIRIYEESLIWEKIINKINPKNLFEICYYSRRMIPVLIAAKKNKIRTIDIQHGKQGEFHICYNNISFIDEGISLYPDVFWNWNVYSANNSLNSIVNSKNKPMNVIGGFQWENFYRNNRIESNELIKFKDFTAKFDKVVLVGTQPIEDGFLPEWFTDGIKENKSILFLFRFHPAQKKERIERMKSLENLPNVESELATNGNIIDIMNVSDAIVSKWSSINFEAVVNEKISILIHENGYKSFKKMVDTGLVKLCLNFNKFIESLTNVEVKNSELEEFRYDVSEEKMGQIIKDLTK